MRNLTKTAFAAALVAMISTGCAESTNKTSQNSISPMTYYASANLMASKQDYNEAIKQYRLAIKGDPKLTRAYNRLGICHHKIDELHHAEATFAAAMKKEPQSPVLLNNLGFTFLRERRFDEAEQKFRQALELNPNFPKARMNLAIALARQDRVGESIMEFGRVVPTEIAYYNVAVVRIEEKDYKSAAWALDKSLEHNPGFAPASENVEQIRFMAKQQERRSGKRIDVVPPKIVFHTRQPDAGSNEPRQQCQQRMSPPAQQPVETNATEAIQIEEPAQPAVEPADLPEAEVPEDDVEEEWDNESDDADSEHEAGTDSDWEDDGEDPFENESPWESPESDETEDGETESDETESGETEDGETSSDATASNNEPTIENLRTIGPRATLRAWEFDCDDPFTNPAAHNDNPVPPLDWEY